MAIDAYVRALATKAIKKANEVSTEINDINTNKVSVSDIINNLTTNVANKPLSAAQGMALKKLMKRGCCILSFLLDTGNFKALYIDGKAVNKMFFNGEKIYENSKCFAIGNKFSSNISTTWGGSGKKLCNLANTGSTQSYCIGKIASSSQPRNTYCCGTNEKSSEFTDLGSITNFIVHLTICLLIAFQNVKIYIMWLVLSKPHMTEIY